MVNEWARQECLMECLRKTKKEAITYFQSCYPSQSFDTDGYMKSGDETWTVAEFFNACSSNQP